MEQITCRLGTIWNPPGKLESVHPSGEYLAFTHDKRIYLTNLQAEILA